MGATPKNLASVRAVSLGELKDTKTRAHRTVRLLAPLQEDLRGWRKHSGPRTDDALVFPSAAGQLWTKTDWDNWRRRAFDRACVAIALYDARPYDLRHSFASLLLHEGRSVMYVARQLGHAAGLTLSTYGHVVDELDDSPQIPAEDAIRAARSGSCVTGVSQEATNA
jgi:integrase